MKGQDVRNSTTAASELTNAERLTRALRDTRTLPLELKALALARSGLLPRAIDVSPRVVRVPSATNWYSTHEWHEIVDGICPCPAVQNGKACYHPHYAQACRDGYYNARHTRMDDAPTASFTPPRHQLFRDAR